LEKIEGKEQKRSSLSTIAKLFLKLGTIGFGGPAVHIALMQQEVARRRTWCCRNFI
jgi:chromate transporter